MTAPMSELSAEKVVAELRERTAFRFAGDCKCGKCQLVPRELVDRAIAALTAAEAEKERYRDALQKIAFLRPVGPTKNKLATQMERIAIDAPGGLGPAARAALSPKKEQGE